VSDVPNRVNLTELCGWACTGTERQSGFKAAKPIWTTPTRRWPISDVEGTRCLRGGEDYVVIPLCFCALVCSGAQICEYTRPYFRRYRPNSGTKISIPKEGRHTKNAHGGHSKRKVFLYQFKTRREHQNRWERGVWGSAKSQHGEGPRGSLASSLESPDESLPWRR
jgi:hypothetical protein